MNNMLSVRARAIKPSTSSEMLRIATRPEIINFGAGIPATEVLPVDEFKEIIEKLFNEKGPATLQYNTTDGYLPLKEAVSKTRVRQ